MNIRIDIVIRAYNEAAQLNRLLEFLGHNHQQQIIVVDNGSTDITVQVAQSFDAKVVHLAQKDFNYPKSSNLGIAAGSSPFIAMISAHALPVERDWIDISLKHFDNTKVAGVYGPVVPFPDSPLLEKTMALLSFNRSTKQITTPRLGILGATNCIIRRDLWEHHPFDETYGAGCEDYEWARWALSKGYKIIYEPRFAVHHSHYLNFKQTIHQYRRWHFLINHPMAFSHKELEFRQK